MNIKILFFFIVFLSCVHQAVSGDPAEGLDFVLDNGTEREEILPGTVYNVRIKIHTAGGVLQQKINYRKFGFESPGDTFLMVSKRKKEIKVRTSESSFDVFRKKGFFLRLSTKKNPLLSVEKHFDIDWDRYWCKDFLKANFSPGSNGPDLLIEIAYYNSVGLVKEFNRMIILFEKNSGTLLIFPVRKDRPFWITSHGIDGKTGRDGKDGRSAFDNDAGDDGEDGEDGGNGGSGGNGGRIRVFYYSDSSLLEYVKFSVSSGAGGKGGRGGLGGEGMFDGLRGKNGKDGDDGKDGRAGSVEFIPVSKLDNMFFFVEHPAFDRSRLF